MKPIAEQFTLPLLEEESLKNEFADLPWKRSQTDKMLDMFLAGAHPKRIAYELGRNRKAIDRRIEQFRCNERDKATRYEPRRRVSRKGKRFTENEEMICRAHRERKVPFEVTAKVLQRAVEELKGSPRLPKETTDMKRLVPSIDLIWSYRYAYYVWKMPVISDTEYDALVEEEIEYGGGERAFAEIKLHRGWPIHIRTLALYLVEKYGPSAVQAGVDPSKRRHGPRNDATGTLSDECGTRKCARRAP